MVEKRLNMAENWKKLFEQAGLQNSIDSTVNKVDELRKTNIIYPEAGNLFRAFNACALADLKVVIIGQDPYHGQGQANGMSFSVNKGIRLPPSLRNIYKELEKEFGKSMPNHGDLIGWAQQGVLLLNSILSVEASKPASHKDLGWEAITDTIISTISSNTEGVVFMLWGSFAISKSKFIDSSKHLVLTSPHPSPFSAHKGFLGNNHFKLCNEYLIKQHKTSIDWFAI